MEKLIPIEILHIDKEYPDLKIISRKSKKDYLEMIKLF